MTATKPRFKVGALGMSIYDTDFAYDAALDVSGDFATLEEREAYAEQIAAKLNFATADEMAGAAVGDHDLGALYRFCEKNAHMYSILRRLVAKGCVTSVPEL